MKSLKIDLLSIRGWKCEFCGIETSNDYQVHHCLFHRMKRRPELDEDYNQMIVCQKCHDFCNSFDVRQQFWKKQVIRYGIVAMLNWYNRVRVEDKPDFWKGSKGCYLQELFGEKIIVWGSREIALIGGNMQRPLNPDQLIKSLYTISTGHIDEVEKGLQGAIIGIIEGLLGSRARRQILLYRLFPAKWPEPKKVSTKDLTPGQWYALKRWVGPVPPPEGATGWYGSADFVAEATLVISKSSAREGQEHLDKNDQYFMEYCQGKYGCVPVMVCGHQATGLTGLFNPYCAECSQGGENKEAYEILANQSIMELQDVNESEYQ